MNRVPIIKQFNAPNHIVVNTYSQSTFSEQNRDNHFIVNLGTTYQNIRRIQLNQFSMLNLYSNIPDQYSDFGYSVDGNYYPLVIDHVYLTLSQFFTYFNNIQSNTVLSYVPDPEQSGFIQIDSTELFSPVGLGWTLLGFGYSLSGISNQEQQLGLPEGLVWDPLYPYDFGGSPVIYVVFNNIINGSNQGDGPVSFCIPNNSTYGTVLHYNSTNQDANQQVYLQSSISITNLDISLLDVYKRPIHTTSKTKDDNCDIPICMSLGAFQD